MEVVIGNISSNETKEIILEKTDKISIECIRLTPVTDLSDIKLIVIKPADKPEIIENITTKLIYNYVEIKLVKGNEPVGKDEIKSLTIKFKVDLTWITENNVDKETITLMNYHNNEWWNLTTTILFEDETYVYYETETYGALSLCVIAGDKVVESLGTEEERTQLLLLIVLIASITTIVLTTASIHKRRKIYYMRNKLNNVHNIELKVNKLLSRLDNKNNKEIKKEKPRNHRNPREKPEQSLRKRK
jgi:PGF-pre-PGF domain-containing protein